MNQEEKMGNHIVKWLAGIAKIIGLFIIYQFALMPVMIPAITHQSSKIFTFTMGATTVILLGLIIWWLRAMYQGISPIKTNLSRPKKPLITLIGLIIVLAICNVLVGFIVTKTTDNQQILNQVFATNPILNIIWIAILAPIVEELIFRGLMYRWLFPHLNSWKSLTFSIIFTGLLFALIHTLSFDLELLAYLPIAIILSLTYVWFNDLRYSIILHVLNNSLAAVGMLIVVLK